MGATVMEIYPKVFLADKRQKIYAKIHGIATGKVVMIKIQPMEIYAIKHTPAYRVDEEERYPFFEMTAEGNGLYSYEYDFFSEQKYDVKIKIDEDILLWKNVYSVSSDLAKLQGYKADTHMHSNRSDGEGTPFEVACHYRAAGYDFISITDHHLYAPSLEAKAEVENLTKEFFVFKGEEVHNFSMGYFHIINFDGNFSVNDVIEQQTDYAKSEVERILQEYDIPDTVADKRDYAFRVFVAQQIQKADGIAILAHPYWDVYGEYHMPTATTEALLKQGVFDAWELLAADDSNGNGSNLQLALWSDLLAQGYTMPVLGASDAHTYSGNDTLFNHQFSLVFAEDFADVKTAIKAKRSVAVLSFNDENFLVFGEFRYVKYARFLLKEFFPAYAALTKEHAAAMLEKDKAAIAKAEEKIAAYKNKFFAYQMK